MGKWEPTSQDGRNSLPPPPPTSPSPAQDINRFLREFCWRVWEAFIQGRAADRGQQWGPSPHCPIQFKEDGGGVRQLFKRAHPGIILSAAEQQSLWRRLGRCS